MRGTFNRIPLDEKQAAVYRNPNNDPRGRWRAVPMTAQGYRPNQMYEITTPSGRVLTPPEGRCWSTIEPEFEKLKEAGRIYFGKNGDAAPGIIRYLSEVEGLVAWTWWPHEDVGHTDESKKEVLALGLEFDTPKPVRLIRRILELASGPNDIILDSFAGSGTTGQAVLDLNKSDGGNRKFILVEIKDTIAMNVTAARLTKVVSGYSKRDDPSSVVEGLGGGFCFCRLGEPLFDEFGDVASEVTFPDLAAHIFFSETGVPIPHRAQSEFLGTFQDRAVYLLFDQANAEQPREAAGNVLTPERLDGLPMPPEGFEGSRVIYAEGCTVSADRLKRAGAVFKQIPYQIDGAR